jgi:hypothetical protein
LITTRTPLLARERAVAAPSPAELAVTSATEFRVRAGMVICAWWQRASIAAGYTMIII